MQNCKLIILLSNHISTSMDSKHVYSNSLKRMLGFKLFPNINPEEVLKVDANKSNNQKLTDFVESKKTDQQIERMKKEIV